jgi:hypothetical protein
MTQSALSGIQRHDEHVPGGSAIWLLCRGRLVYAPDDIESLRRRDRLRWTQEIRWALSLVRTIRDDSDDAEFQVQWKRHNLATPNGDPQPDYPDDQQRYAELNRNPKALPST